jgi:3-dehydroquinate synthase
MVSVRVPIVERRDASYEIAIGRGLISELPSLLERACPATRYAVVTDSHVRELWGHRVMEALSAAGIAAELIVFPAGEWNKTRESWGIVSDRMLGAKLGRDCAVIALGGGVVGDLAGFVAATYLRGVPYVQVPTTLLAMIDSSVGGKTGVDVPAGKNLLGAFHQPRFVLADLDVLGTLPKVQFAAGLAEAVKHGAIADAEYFSLLESESRAVQDQHAVVLERVVVRSVEIKAAVVAEDEREQGRRAILNFGHTVGHAIEATLKFEMLHGEAVAIGMICEARLAERLGVAERGTAERIARVLERYGLPLELPAAARLTALLDAMEYDKKARGAQIRFALPQRIGVMHHSAGGWTMPVEPTTVQAVLTPPFND